MASQSRGNRKVGHSSPSPTILILVVVSTVLVLTFLAWNQLQRYEDVYSSTKIRTKQTKLGGGCNHNATSATTGNHDNTHRSVGNASFSPTPSTVPTTLFQSKKTIPFFVYPPSQFPNTFGLCSPTKIIEKKHSHFPFALEAMMRHPRRVPHLEEAKIAFIPIPLDHWSRKACHPNVTSDTILQEIDNILLDQHPTTTSTKKMRRFMIANDWMMLGKHPSLFHDIQKKGIIMAAMEGRKDCQTSIGYLSNYALYSAFRRTISDSEANPRKSSTTLVPNANTPASQRIYSINMVGQIDARRSYSDRAVLFSATKGKIDNAYMISHDSNIRIKGKRACVNVTSCLGVGQDFDRCSILDKFNCPNRIDTHRAQELSNYTLCLRGDTLGSDRWTQAMVTGTAIIAVVNSPKDLDWAPFPFAIPWKDLVLTIQRKTFVKDPVGSLQQIMAKTTPQKLQELQDLSRYHAADLDWTAYNSRTLENMIYEAYTIPCSYLD